MPHGAHIPDGLSGLNTCLDATSIRFVESADARQLDVTCFGNMTPPPFADAP